ncbi:hypothetical protein GOODEAATRI_009818 [Goodea atripinnis]|uniref:Uncharacterized protein n=1 Tax=Goodea atripinnis TaxID=208336 RepID=A0ABV0P2V5_9TELE
MGHASSACPPEALLHYASLDWQAEVTSTSMGGTSSQYKRRRHVGDLQSRWFPWYCRCCENQGASTGSARVH